MATAIFVGSFDPFTIGHQSVVDRALPLFDRLVIGVGVNERKQCMFTAEQRVEAIRQLYAHDARVVVDSYADLTISFARRHQAAFVVKGVRNVRDFEYEREQADINRRLSGLETYCCMPSLGLIALARRWCASWLTLGKMCRRLSPSRPSMSVSRPKKNK